MAFLLSLLAMCSSDCFRFENTVVDLDMAIAPLACFEFVQPTFKDINLTITLQVDAGTN
jgi:hypothetical protein